MVCRMPLAFYPSGRRENANSLSRTPSRSFPLTQGVDEAVAVAFTLLLQIEKVKWASSLYWLSRAQNNYNFVSEHAAFAHRSRANDKPLSRTLSGLASSNIHDRGL